MRDHLTRGFLLGIWLVLLLPGSAAAHDATDWFDPIRWDVHQDVNYKIDDSIPGGDGSAFENRIHDAADAWNAVTGVDGFQFDDVGNGNNDYEQPCNWEDNTDRDIWFYSNDIAPWGVTKACFVYHPGAGFTDLQSARITLDADLGDFTWFSGTGNVPSDQVSVEETVLHELGHATGTYWGGSASGNSGGHWIEGPSAHCTFLGAESDYTMCPFGFDGFSFGLPLEPHDIDTFQDFY